MKLNFSKYKNIINILLPLIITVSTFYSGNIDQRISQIYSDYLIATNTLNNSFIAMNIKASLNDDAGFQKIKDDTAKYLEKFNIEYDYKENLKKKLETRKKYIDYSIYILSFLLFIINAVYFERKRKNIKKEKEQN